MSKLILPFDTETTGIPDWKTPSGGENQPHIVQLAAHLVDEDTREIKETMNVIIKPDGWSWDSDDEAFKTHGITMEQARDQGIPEPEALGMFLDMWEKCDTRIAFNTTFDNRIIRIAIKRYLEEEREAEKWKAGKYFCTMINAKKIMGGKNPKLGVAYQHLIGKELEGAHDALVDVNACLELYFAIQDYRAKVA